MAPLGPEEPVMLSMPSQENVEVSEPVVTAEGTAEFLEASIVMETEWPLPSLAEAGLPVMK